GSYCSSYATSSTFDIF
nr:immunoglobulin light chain junction region [Macaca mulatta]